MTFVKVVRGAASATLSPDGTKVTLEGCQGIVHAAFEKDAPVAPRLEFNLSPWGARVEGLQFFSLVGVMCDVGEEEGRISFEHEDNKGVLVVGKPLTDRLREGGLLIIIDFWR